MEIAKTARKLIGEKALLFVCDVQDKFAPKTYKHEGVVEAVGMMCEVAGMFSIPTLFTEQNPPVFGDTYPDFFKKLGKAPYFKTAKTQVCFYFSTFSMVNNQTLEFLKKYPERKQVVLVGMETHICVLQTFLELSSMNYDVFFPVDCLTSTRALDRTAALTRIAHSGGVISTFEMLTFELLKDYKHENFKKVLNILKGTKRENMIPHL